MHIVKVTVNNSESRYYHVTEEQAKVLVLMADSSPDTVDVSFITNN